MEIGQVLDELIEREAETAKAALAVLREYEESLPEEAFNEFLNAATAFATRESFLELKEKLLKTPINSEVKKLH